MGRLISYQGLLGLSFEIDDLCLSPLWLRGLSPHKGSGFGVGSVRLAQGGFRDSGAGSGAVILVCVYIYIYTIRIY